MKEFIVVFLGVSNQECLLAFNPLSFCLHFRATGATCVLVFDVPFGVLQNHSLNALGSSILLFWCWHARLQLLYLIKFFLIHLGATMLANGLVLIILKIIKILTPSKPYLMSFMSFVRSTRPKPQSFCIKSTTQYWIVPNPVDLKCSVFLTALLFRPY